MHDLSRSSIFKRLRSRAAETLAEVIIAITVLTLGTGSATVLVMTSIRATHSGEDRLVAYNLAREGVEAVRNLRDTNWLRFPSERASCWDTYGVTVATACGTGNKLGTAAPGQTITVSPNLTGPNELFTWTVVTTPTSPQQKLYVVSAPGGGTLYTHDSTYMGATLSPFSRLVTIVKTPGNATIPAQMVVTATVSWEESGRPTSVSFTDQLINY